ncbi:hypothetical protein [Mixta intestinalis]|uniref:hypothetical protein n=1 Tax=Mixta intestinalis TaxID=1615494 RepID=UPI0013682420|nr:hypothetical protein [Mixta intestinalis]
MLRSEPEERVKAWFITRIISTHAGHVEKRPGVKSDRNLTGETRVRYLYSLKTAAAFYTVQRVKMQKQILRSGIAVREF